MTKLLTTLLALLTINIGSTYAQDYREFSHKNISLELSEMWMLNEDYLYYDYENSLYCISGKLDPDGSFYLLIYDKSGEDNIDLAYYCRDNYSDLNISEEGKSSTFSGMKSKEFDVKGFNSQYGKLITFGNKSFDYAILYFGDRFFVNSSEMEHSLASVKVDNEYKDNTSGLTEGIYQKTTSGEHYIYDKEGIKFEFPTQWSVMQDLNSTFMVSNMADSSIFIIMAMPNDKNARDQFINMKDQLENNNITVYSERNVTISELTAKVYNIKYPEISDNIKAEITLLSDSSRIYIITSLWMGEDNHNIIKRIISTIHIDEILRPDISSCVSEETENDIKIYDDTDADDDILIIEEKINDDGYKIITFSDSSQIAVNPAWEISHSNKENAILLECSTENGIFNFVITRSKADDCKKTFLKEIEKGKELAAQSDKTFDLEDWNFYIKYVSNNTQNGFETTEFELLEESDSNISGKIIFSENNKAYYAFMYAGDETFLNSKDLKYILEFINK